MNMYKGPMDKAKVGKWGRIEGGRWGWVGWGKVVVEKWRQLYSNINFKKVLYIWNPPWHTKFSPVVDITYLGKSLLPFFPQRCFTPFQTQGKKIPPKH